MSNEKPLLKNDQHLLDTWAFYPSYHELKSSSANWVQIIPSHWTLAPLRWVSRIYAGGTPDKENESYWADGTIPWINSGAVNQVLITKPSNYITEKGYRNSSANWILQGALVIALAGQGKTKGMVAQLAIDTTCNQSMAALVPGKNIFARFLFWWLTANYLPIRNLSGGDLRDGLNLELIGSIPCPILLMDEQISIANFLDNHTSKLDALIAKKERLIELLQEKRTAIINKAVTKGLEQNIPMKDSGIESIGKIPAHWRVTRLKFLAEVRQGVTKGRDLEGRDTIELPYLRVANVQDGYLDLSDIANILIAKSEIDRFSLHFGDILMNEGGDYDKLGRGAVWTGQIERCLHQNHVFAVRPFDKSLSTWINTITLTSYAKFYFMSKSKQSTNLASISGSNIKELPVILPPENNRKQILNYIDSVVNSIDKLTSKIESNINLLKEYRAALITGAVTGKIDVRGEA